MVLTILTRAKRYERLMKANGIHPNGGPSEKSTMPATPRDKPKATVAKAPALKKRKIEAVDNDNDRLLMKAKVEPSEPKEIKPEPASNETKSSLTLLSPSASTGTPSLVPVQYPPQPRPQNLFSAPQMSYPQQRHYHPNMAHMAHMAHIAQYSGPLLQIPPPRSPPAPLIPREQAVQPPSIASRLASAPEDNVVFEEFCTPELFEQRTFMEVPQLEHSEPIPPPPQEVTMKDLSIEEKLPEEKAAESRSGRRPSESILIID